MLRKHDYHCETNGRTLEAEHSWSIKLHTWGELTDLLGIDPGSTPREAPIRRLIGSPALIRKRDHGSDGEDGEEGSQPKPKGLHPLGCLCGCVPSSPGIREFQQKLVRMMNKKGENHE